MLSGESLFENNQKTQTSTVRRKFELAEIKKYSFNGLFTNSGLQSWGNLPSNYILERDSPKPLLDRGSIRVDDLLATSMDPREDVIQSDQLLKKIEERLQSLVKLKFLELRRSILLSASLI